MAWANSAVSAPEDESAVGGLGTILALASGIPMRHLGWLVIPYVVGAYVVALTLSFILFPIF
jgi:hypothetical protein